MGIIDKIRSFRRIDPKKAEEEAYEEKEAREILEAEKKKREEENREERIRQRTEDLREGSARADQNKFLSNVNIFKVTKERHFWLAFILWIIFIFLLLYYGAYKYILPSWLKIETFNVFGLVVYSGIILFIIYIIAGFVSAAKNPNSDIKITNFFVALVLVVWLWDMAPPTIFGIPIPWGGIYYQGFIWDWNGVLYTTWLLVLTSSIMFAFLYINLLFKIVEKEYLGAILSFFFIIIVNKIAPYIVPTQLTYSIPIPWGNAAFLVSVFLGLGIISFLIYIYKKQGISSAVPNFLSFLFMAFVFSFFWVNNGWLVNIKAIAHAIYIVVFGFFYITRMENRNPSVWHFLIPILLIADFYGYGALFGSDILVLKFFPVLVLFVVFYCYHKSRSIYALTTVAVIVTIILILSLQAGGYQGSKVTFTPNEGGADIQDFFGTLFGKTQEAIVSRLDYATGGLYRGNVEKNQYESLGVYFFNIKQAEPKFYTDEPVTVWGSIRSKTYQDPVIVNFKCYRWKGSDQKNRIQSAKYEPKNPFLVFQLEQNDVECTFQENDKEPKLDVGYNTVTLSAEYNFATNAYKKAYFIDRERYRSLIKESIDPLKEFGIQDKEPKAVFTNGPVEIGIDIQSLTPVSDSYIVYPTLGISLLNRQSIEDKDKKIITKWEGRIKNITELVILMPPGIDIANKENLESACSKENIGKGECPCNRPFVSYDSDKCSTSCSKQVREPCDNACSYYEKGSKTRDDCLKTCKNSFDNCNNECNNLFGVGEGESSSNKYNGYALDVENLQYKNDYKDIDSDRHRTFVCRVKPTTQALDNSPITTRYVRARARYNYVLENSVKVNVEQARVPSETVINVPEFYSQIPEATYQGIYYNANNDNEKKYSGLVFKYTKENNVEYLFVKAIIQKESSWNPAALGDGSNSIGLMQMSKGTATGLGCDVSKLSEPEENVRCGVRYIKSLIDSQKDSTIKSDLRNIAAAYNCGAKAMNPDSNYGLLWKNPDSCWDKSHTTNTRIYVDKVMEYYNKMRSQLETATSLPGGGTSAP